MDAPAGHGTRLPEGAQEEAPVVIIYVDGLTPVAPRHDVVIGARELEAQAAGHGHISVTGTVCQDMTTDPIFHFPFSAIFRSAPFSGRDGFGRLTSG
jgi:hypothetical protein